MISQHRDGFGSIKITARNSEDGGIGCSQIYPHKFHGGDVKVCCDGKGDGDLPPFMPSEVTTMYHSFPFRFLVPDNACDSKCCWIYPVTFGGGLVAGDKIDVQYEVGNNCAAVVNSQESTKVYHCLKGEQTLQTSTYICGESALLCILMEPVVCYKDAYYLQKQVVNLNPTSNVVFLDWMLSGRDALDESWDFKRYCNTIEIYLEDELVLRECTDLQDTVLTRVKDSMGEFKVLGTCVMLGTYLHSQSEALLERYGRKRDLGEQCPRGLVVSVSPLSYKGKGHEVAGCYLRFMAVDITTASSVIRAITQPLLPVLGADPFERKL